MSNVCPIRIFLACLIAANAFADSGAPEKRAAGNWQWSVTLIKEPNPDLDTLVHFPQASDQKTTKVVEKACREIKAQISELASVTFHDNPPMEGRIILTLTLKRNVKWNPRWHLLVSDNRAAAVADLLREGRDTKALDQTEELPLSESRSSWYGKGRDFEIVSVRAELIRLDSLPIASHECPRNDEGRPELKELARIIASDMIRFAASNRETAHPETDSALMR